MKNFQFLSPWRQPPLWLAISALGLALACSSNNPPADGFNASSSTKSKGRLVVATSESTSAQVIDLELGQVEASPLTLASAPMLAVSADGSTLFAVQPSSNLTEIFKMGASIASPATASTTVDAHAGHSHKPRENATTEASSTTTITGASSASSVERVNLRITGQGPVLPVVGDHQTAFYHSVSGKTVVWRQDFINSINEASAIEIAGFGPGVPFEKDEVVFAANIYSLASGKFEDLNALSTNVTLPVSAARVGETSFVFGTAEGVIIVRHDHATETWSRELLARKTDIDHATLYHGHSGVDTAHAQMVVDKAVVSQWITHPSLPHAFAHLSRSAHSAGIYLVEVEAGATGWERIDGTSAESYYPVASALDESGEYLVILLSNGKVRLHDAHDEGKFLLERSVVSAMDTDFLNEPVASVTTEHSHDQALPPGLAVGLGKIFVGDTQRNLVHQLDLKTLKSELTWKVDSHPERLALLGAILIRNEHEHTH